MKEFVYHGGGTGLAKTVTERLGLPYATVQKLLRRKDIKVNGARVKANVMLCDGDKVTVYEPVQKKLSLLGDRLRDRTVYEDAEIVVTNKPKGMEIAEAEQELTALYGAVYAVHRLDRDTEGLLFFARTEAAKVALEEAFRSRSLEKYYLALVSGIPHRASAQLKAYLYKDAVAATVRVSDTPRSGYVPIETFYRVLERYDDTALVEVRLVTGRTHQIRAHLLHIGHPIVGDSKYGDNAVNRRHRKKSQCLACVRVVLHLPQSGVLDYLDGREFAVKASF